MTERRVVVVGGKGSALNVAEQIEDARRRFGISLRCLGFAIDDPAPGSTIVGLPVLCGLRDAWARFRDADVEFLFALYRPDVMSARYELLRSLGIPDSRFATFVHPSAYVSPSAHMGPGCIVLSHTTVQQGVTIGGHSILNSNVVVEHEASLAEGVFVAAGACIGARVRVGRSSFLGLSATIREDVVVGNGAFVGMAATVVHDVAPGTLVYGSPARARR